MGLIALLFALALCETKMENGIMVLDDSNFQTVTKENENMFVEFYSTVLMIYWSEYLESSSFLAFDYYT